MAALTLQNCVVSIVATIGSINKIAQSENIGLLSFYSTQVPSIDIEQNN